MHAFPTGRSGWTHFALAISTRALSSASSARPHASGHLKSSAFIAAELSFAEARHASAERFVCGGGEWGGGRADGEANRIRRASTTWHASSRRGALPRR